MTWLSSCPFDGGNREFYGISTKPTGERDRDTYEPILEKFRWTKCSVCGRYFQETDHKIINFQKDEPPKSLFKVSRDE